MPELSEIIQDSVETDIDLRGVTVHVTYKPSIFTPQLEAKMAEAEVGKQGAALAEMLSEFVVDWDLTSDGQPLPCTVETMMSLPIPLLGDFARLLGEEMTEEIREQGKA